MHETYEDNLEAEPDSAVVHWMDRPRHHLTTAGLTGVVTGAFLIGAGVGIAIAMLAPRISPEDGLRSRAERFFH